MQGAGTYSPLDDDKRLLGIPASWGRVTAPNPNFGQVCEIRFSFRSRSPLSWSLYATCSPENSGHTDLPSPSPSSHLTRAVRIGCISPGGEIGNYAQGSRSLLDLTRQFVHRRRVFPDACNRIRNIAPRADDGHAAPLGSSGKIFSLAVNLPSPPVIFLALYPIEPQHPPLVVLPRQFL